MAELTKLNFIQYLCEKKLKELGLHENQEYISRLERELTNVDVQEIHDDILKLLKANIKIQSHHVLMYYLLGISQTDPIKTGINIKIKKPSSFPDIDTDFSVNERELVIKYFIEKYGNDHVAPIGSYGQMKMKMVIRDIARIYDIDISDTNEVAKNLQEDVDNMTEEEFDIIIAKEPGEDGFRNDMYELRKYFERHVAIRDIVFKLKGQLRHLTKHPAGVVATPGLIDESIPLMKHKDELITSWVDGVTRKDLQSSGFIKFDILGLKTLTIVKEILELIKIRKAFNKDADFDIESLDHGQQTSLLYEEFSAKLPLDGNVVVYDKFKSADTNGIFQFECIAGDSWIGNYRMRELYNKFSEDPSSVHKISGVKLRGRFKVRQKISAMSKKVGKVYRLVAGDNNMCIEATLLHEFYTLHGWKKLEELFANPDEYVMIDREKNRYQYYCDRRDCVLDRVGVDRPCRKCIKAKENTCKGEVLQKFKTYRSRYKFIKIKHITYVGEQEVYDLGFEDKPRRKTKKKRPPVQHNYIANGFVVHNSALMRSLLKEIKPTCFIDITSTTALGRPGPLDMGMHKEYAARKNGKIFDYGSSRIEECLKESYGILVYQEDVMRLCNMVAGFPLDLTDTVRKNLMKSVRDGDAKDKAAKERAKIHDMFIAGFGESGLKQEVAESWWQNCVAFARYGFNKSHAVAYTVLSYQMMWFKVYYPLEFYVVLFSNSPKEKFASYFGEAMNKNINIVPADITRAKDGFTIHSGENSIMFGLGHIMGVGPAIINNITSMQPFDSFEDFWNKTSKVKKISKLAMDALINAHAFDCFGSQNEILEKYYTEIRKESSWQRTVDYEDKKFEHEKFVEAYSLDWRTKLSDDQKKEVTRLGAKLLTKFVQPKQNTKRTVWGIITEVIKKTSKNDNNYYYVMLTDSKFNIAKLRIPTYNRRCKKAFLFDRQSNKYKKVVIDDVIQVDNVLVGEAETSEYMGRIFADMYDICCIGNVYEKTLEQKQRLEKYEDMFNEK
jgi:DNA polymerase III alpha subunit